MDTARHLLIAGLLAAALPALAGTVQVTVVSADGKPVADTVVLVQPTASWSPQPLPAPAVVAQKDIRFVPYVTVIPVGGTIRFINEDSFDHHVRSLPGGPLGTVAPAREFEIRMPAVAHGRKSTADLKIDLPGVIVLGCHLHGSMRGHVLVSVSPWYAVTDAQGHAVIDGMPDGQAELKLWHPDQLVDQGTTRVQVAAAGPTVAEAKLNFTPKRRAAPAARDSYTY
jgi:plastocyanin